MSKRQLSGWNFSRAPETGLLVGQKLETSRGEMSFSFQYTEIDGISFVTGIQARQEDNYVQNIKIENAVDVDVDESVFEVPDEVKQAWKEGRWPGKDATAPQKLKRDR